MKTTMLFRSTANPKRTTLANLTDAGELTAAELPEHAAALPATTANPKRTQLMVAPVPHQASSADQ